MGRSIVRFLSFLKGSPDRSGSHAVMPSSLDPGGTWTGRPVRRGMARRLGVLCLLLSCHAGTLWAATITAPTCSYTDVLAALNKAANGDTVLVPPGTCTWNQSMDFDLNINGGKNKYLTLQGAGIDQTVIIDNVSKDPYPNISYLLRWTTVNAGLTRITGFTFQGGTNVDNLNSGMLYFRGNSHLFRFDHNKVIATTTSGIRTFGYLLGVLDHNTFDVSKSSLGLQLVHSTWSTPGTSYGDVSWALPDTLGTDQNLFVEDNVFTNDQSVRFFNYANDGYSGARVVFRKNTYINAVWANHGTDTGGRERSMRQFEVYDNTFKMDLQGNGFASVIGTRGGVGVVYNNTVTVSSGTLGTVFDLQYYRAVDDRNQQFGRCNGTNPWDENSLATGYRCLDQPGVGEGDLLSGAIPINTTTGRASTAHQVPNPNYAWNNTKNGALSQPISNVPSVVALGRDYLNQPRPGYTPYTYPHPLTTGSGTTNDPPSPPQNLNIQ